MNKISQAEKPPAAGASRLLLPVDFQPNPNKDILMSTTTTTSSLSFAARTSNALLHRTIENCLVQYRRQFSVLETSSRKQHFEAVATTLVNLFVGDGFRFIVVVAPSSAETSTSTGPSYYQVPLQEAIRAVQNHLMTRSFTVQAQDSSSTPSQVVVQAQNNKTSHHGSSADIIISTPKNFNSNDAPASTSSSTTPALPLITHATTVMKNHSSLQESTNNPTAASSSATTTAMSRAPVIHADQSGGGASAFDRWSPNTMHAATTLSMLSQHHHHSNQNQTEEFSTLNENDPTFTTTTTPAGPRQLWWTSANRHPNHPQGATSAMAPATISPETVLGAVSHGIGDDTANKSKSHKTLEFGRASADYQALVQAHVAAYAEYQTDNDDGSRIKINFCRALLQSLGYTSFVNVPSGNRHNVNRSPLTFQQAARKLQKSLAHAVSKLTRPFTDTQADPSSSDIMEVDGVYDVDETTFASGGTTTKRQRAFQVGRYNPVYQAMVQAHASEYAGLAAGTKMEYCRSLLKQFAQEHGCTTSWFVQKHGNDEAYDDDTFLTLEEAAIKLQKSFGHVLAKQKEIIATTQEATSQKKTQRGNHHRRGAAEPMTLQQATTKKLQKSASRRRIIIMNDNDDEASRLFTHILPKKNKKQIHQNLNKIVLFGRGVKSDLNPDYLERVKANARGYQQADNKKAFMRDFAQSLLDDGWEFYKADQKQRVQVKVVDLDRLVSVKIKNDFRRRLT